MTTLRRTDYEPVGSQDRIMAPLLRDHIRQTLDSLAARLPEGFRVLDIGAGECPWKAGLEKRGACYESLDLSQNRSATIDHVGRIDALLPERLRSGEPFDVLLCTEVLEHVPDWQSAFENFQRLLAPGGYLLITCPFFYMLHEEPHDFWRPTDHALKDFAARNGFVIETEKRLGDGADVLGTLLGSLHVQRRKKSPFAYLPTVIIHLLLKLVRAVVSCPRMKRFVAIEGRFYLSNFLLLKKLGRS